jgi:hypothetical protein
VLTVHATKKLAQRLGGFTKNAPSADGVPLAAHDAPAEFIASALDRTSDDAVCVPTESRSTLGVVNELVRHAGYALDDAGGDIDLVGLAVWLSNTPMSPLYKRRISPDRELAALIEKSSS